MYCKGFFPHERHFVELLYKESICGTNFTFYTEYVIPNIYNIHQLIDNTIYLFKLDHKQADMLQDRQTDDQTNRFHIHFSLLLETVKNINFIYVNFR